MHKISGWKSYHLNPKITKIRYELKMQFQLTREKQCTSKEPDVHDLIDQHQCMNAGVERTDVDDLIQSVDMIQYCRSVSCHTHTC